MQGNLKIIIVRFMWEGDGVGSFKNYSAISYATVRLKYTASLKNDDGDVLIETLIIFEKIVRHVQEVSHRCACLFIRIYIFITEAEKNWNTSRNMFHSLNIINKCSTLDTLYIFAYLNFP